MPISWLPLVADSTRFARDERGVFGATFAGYAIGNAWFYVLGALLVLHAAAPPDALGLGRAIAELAGGTSSCSGSWSGRRRTRSRTCTRRRSPR